MAVPGAREPEQRPGSPLAAMQKQTERAAALVTRVGWPKDIPCTWRDVPSLAAPSLPLTCSVPAPGARAGQRARRGDLTRRKSRERPTACAKTVPYV